MRPADDGDSVRRAQPTPAHSTPAGGYDKTMAVRLSDRDKRMLDGDIGPAARLAMSVMVRMAEVYGAEELMDITQAHIDAVGILSTSGLELAETLAATGGRVVVPTTLNMVPIDIAHWREWDVPVEHADMALRQVRAYAQMGCIPTCTCAPYQGYLTPRFGQQIAWAESNAIVYANSVLGARTNRYGDFVDICAAITGRVPKTGLHITENRRGQILLRLVDLSQELLHDGEFYAVLGHFLGKAAGERIAVIDGLPTDTGLDQLKALGAASASSGAVGLFHAVGVTPEAPTLRDAFQGGQPEHVIEVRRSDLLAARSELSTAAEGDSLGAIIMGCPHFSFGEFQHLAHAIRSQHAHAIAPEVLFLVMTNQAAYALLERSDDLELIRSFGVRILLDACVFHFPIVPPMVRVVMTTSGKHAYYAPGELGVQVAFGSLHDCVRSAVAGRVLRGVGLWTE